MTLPLTLKAGTQLMSGLGGMGRFAFGQESEARPKLTNADTYRHRRYSGARDDIDEVFLKVADLTEQNLKITQMRMPGLTDVSNKPHVSPRHTIIMCVEVVPLTEKEVAWLKADRAGQESKI